MPALAFLPARLTSALGVKQRHLDDPHGHTEASADHVLSAALIGTIQGVVSRPFHLAERERDAAAGHDQQVWS